MNTKSSINWLSKESLNWIKLLTNSDLKHLLSKVSPKKASQIIEALKYEALHQTDEHDKDIERKRIQRSKSAEVTIGQVADPERRARCLADPKEFLKEYGWCTTYNRPLFYNDWAEHHLAMIEAIKQRAFNGGDKAIAAPRGDGKSSVVMMMAIWVALANLRRSIIIIAATGKKAKEIFDKIKWHFARMPKLMGDFPEICDCVAQLDGAPARANKQHVQGVPTDIKWTQDEIRLPKVQGSPYGGIHIEYRGLDSAIRGGRFEFALIDDPETDEVARGEQHWKIERIIDREVAGLAPPDKRISRVVVTTIQNPYCYSARVTNRGVKPTFAGDRYGMLAKWPDNKELWEEYVALRKQAQFEGDKDGLKALEFYKANRDDMDQGAVLTNPYRFSSEPNEDGVQVEITALQAFYNRVADWGMDAVMSELQNDPQDDSKIDTVELTSGVVLSRKSGFDRNEIPPGSKITLGLDLGDRYGHWVKVAWMHNSAGVVIDYGVMEVPGMLGKAGDVPTKVIQEAIYDALHLFRDSMEKGENPPEFSLIDSGDGEHTDAVYRFVHSVPGEFYEACKGPAGGIVIPNKRTQEKVPFHQCYAAWQQTQRLWLYHVNTDYWQEWIQHRFLLDTFDAGEAQEGKLAFTPGSLSLFRVDKPREHLAFAQHLVSHKRQTKFVEGKGRVSKWIQVNRNNHWLDAFAYAAAAATCLGVIEGHKDG